MFNILYLPIKNLEIIMSSPKKSRFQRLKSFFYDKKAAPHYKFKKLLGLRYHEISDPGMIRTVLNDLEHFGGPAFQRKMAGELIGDALINAEGASWERQRKLFQGFFSAKSVLENIGPIVVEESEAMVNRWIAAKADTIDVEYEMRRMSGHVIMRSLFGNSIKAEDADTIIDLISTASIQTLRGLSPVGIALRASGVHKLIESAAALGGDMPKYYKSKEYEAMKEKIDGIVYPIIAARRALAKQPDDILGAMIAPPDGEKPLSDKEIRDELIMFIVAGHDTTSVGLTYGLLEALKNPADLQQIQKEVDAITKTKPLEARDFMKLPALQQSFKEAVRLHPPSHSVGKEAIKDVTINGIDFKRGDIVKINIPDSLQAPDLWPAADTFDPARQPAGFKSHPDYMAFGHGQRKCPGMALSFAEGTLTLAEIFSKVTLSIVQEPEGEDHASFSTRIVGKALCKVAPKTP